MGRGSCSRSGLKFMETNDGSNDLQTTRAEAGLLAWEMFVITTVFNSIEWKKWLIPNSIIKMQLWIKEHANIVSNNFSCFSSVWMKSEHNLKSHLAQTSSNSCELNKKCICFNFYLLNLNPQYASIGFTCLNIFMFVISFRFPLCELIMKIMTGLLQV